MKHYYCYDTIIGRIRIVDNGEAITEIAFTDRQESVPQGAAEVETPLIAKAQAQLSEYFLGERKEFELPLAPEGTEFQKRDWEELQKIPYGQTRTYGQIAAAVGSPKGARAVGLANNRNPIVVVIPCHRVIGAGGKLVGYGGGMEIKEKLLRLEGAL